MAQKNVKSSFAYAKSSVRACVTFLVICALLIPATIFSIDTNASAANYNASAATHNANTNATHNANASGSNYSASSNSDPSNWIRDFQVLEKDTKKLYGQALDTKSDFTLEINQRAGSVELVVQCEWTNAQGQTHWEDGSGRIIWASSDSNIAAITQDGRITAIGDGTCDITCTIKEPEEDSKGVALTSTTHVTVTNQSTARRVKKDSIRIYYGDTEVSTTSPYQDKTKATEADVAKTTMDLHAKLTILDPVSNQEVAWDTKDGKISTAFPDVADLLWEVSDGERGSIDEDTGVYRPKKYGSVIVSAWWAKGADSATETREQATFAFINPDSDSADGYNPQTQITVRVFYERNAPSNLMSENDEDFVYNRTFSLSSLEALGLHNSTYSSIEKGGGTYMTISARGVMLTDLLTACNLNPSEVDIKELSFKGADQYVQGVSYSWLYQQRYYYPNASSGGSAAYSGGQSVWPMLAVATGATRKNGSTYEDYDNMTKNTRFHFLVGGSKEGSNSGLWVHNVRTVYVVLKGGEPYNPDPVGPDDPTNPDAPVNPDSPDNPVNPDEPNNPNTNPSIIDGSGGTGQNSGTVGEGSGMGGASGGSGYSTTGSTGAGSTGTRAYSTANTGSNGENSTGTAGSGNAFSVYQVLNPNNDISTLDSLDINNPIAWLVWPIGILAFAFGGLQAFMWYRKQRRMTRYLDAARAGLAEPSMPQPATPDPKRASFNVKKKEPKPKYTQRQAPAGA